MSARKRAITVTCSACDGEGAVPIADQYSEILDLLGAEWISTSDIHEKLKSDLQPTALANRLTWLEKHSLAQSRVKPGNMRMKEWRLL